MSERMSGVQRREQILRAALRAFADGGYAGTSTDQVAKAAGVSQPYVVRLFGSKQQLFAEVYGFASDRVVETLGGVPAGPDAKEQMGEAYVRLLDDRDLLLVIMHGFIAGADPVVGKIARHTLAEAFRIYRERTGGSEQDARTFVAHGMLINVLLATGAAEHLGEDADLDGLTECTLGAGLQAALAATSR
jgi:AcrR family transcriptional regulator